ncbi:MAG: isocitrate/isopropylmalate dehydrogenase family protein [Pseudomonadota bacterium]
MTTYNIAYLPGDGIGPEVLASARRVVDTAVNVISGIEINYEPVDAGAETYARTGEAVPDVTIKRCREADAIFFGSAGLPEAVYPDGTEVGVEASLQMRFQLDLYANIRPIKLYPNIKSPLADRQAGDIDYIVLRENVEGLYASRGGGSILRDAVATDTMVITRSGTERVTRKAFELARGRNGAPGDGKRRVTCVDKANILRSFSFWRRVFDQTAVDYADIEADHAYTDAMTCYMVQSPGFYDVMVMENMFGDILTDLAAATVGGMGMSPSAEIGDNHGLFQGSHGSAPTLVGKNIANPMATIVSGAMMLDWLGQKRADNASREAARAIEAAVTRTFEDGIMTPDVGGEAGTEAFSDAVIERLQRH